MQYPPKGPPNRTFEGRLHPAGVTSYMYGSHVLVTRDGRFAVRPASPDVTLKDYEGKNVTVRAMQVDRYPVDGGPPLIEVREIKVQ